MFKRYLWISIFFFFFHLLALLSSLMTFVTGKLTSRDLKVTDSQLLWVYLFFYQPWERGRASISNSCRSPRMDAFWSFLVMCPSLSLCLWSGMPASHWSDWGHMIIPRVRGRVSLTETTWSENGKGWFLQRNIEILTPEEGGMNVRQVKLQMSSSASKG